MPTADWNARHYAWDQPAQYESHAPRVRPDMIEPYGQGVGAAVEHWSQGQRSPQRYQPGPRRTASQARVVSAMAHGQSDAMAHRMYSARPFSRERRDARQQWRRAEEYVIQADALAWALTREVMLGEFFGDI